VSMNMSDYYGSQYLNATNLPEGVHRVKVSNIAEVTFDDGKRKPCLSFEGREKTLPLIKTNADRIADVYGKVISDWPIGFELDLYTETVQGPNGPTKDLRVRVIPPAAPAAATATAATAAAVNKPAF
jgi:hypothetical protein